MNAVAWIVIIVTIVVALIILAGAAWFAVDSDKRVRRFARSNDLIPGQPSRAPDDWTTSTSREFPSGSVTVPLGGVRIRSKER